MFRCSRVGHYQQNISQEILEVQLVYKPTLRAQGFIKNISSSENAFEEAKKNTLEYFQSIGFKQID